MAKKLGIRAGETVAVLAAPEHFAGLLDGLPEGARLAELSDRAAANASANAHVLIVAFVRDSDELAARLPVALRLLDPYGALWIGWPKKSSRLFVDVTEDDVRDLGLALGVVDNKVCAIDEDWSGLRLVVRLADRPPRR